MGLVVDDESAKQGDFKFFIKDKHNVKNSKHQIPKPKQIQNFKIQKQSMTINDNQ